MGDSAAAACPRCWVARRVEPYLRELGEVHTSVMYATRNRASLTERDLARVAMDLLRVRDLADDAAAALREDSDQGDRWTWEARAYLVALSAVAVSSLTAVIFREGEPSMGRRLLELLEGVLDIQQRHEEIGTDALTP